jgi:hypothetical protein
MDAFWTSQKKTISAVPATLDLAMCRADRDADIILASLCRNLLPEGIGSTKPVQEDMLDALNARLR